MPSSASTSTITPQSNLKFHPTTQRTLRVAVLFEANQLSDIVCIDLLGNCSRLVIEPAAKDFPLFAPFLEHTPDIEFLYVSSSLDPAKTTPDVRIVPTHTYDTCPRDVDILLMGGPLLSHRPEASLRLMREVAELGKTTIMTTCVGALWLADSGVLKGRKATTNRGVLPFAQKIHPHVEWVDQRWVVEDGDEGKCDLWTSGGAGCGIDMMGHYLKKNFHPMLVEAALVGMEFNPLQKDIGVNYARPLVDMHPTGVA